MACLRGAFSYLNERLFLWPWIPAFAGMTKKRKEVKNFPCPLNPAPLVPSPQSRPLTGPLFPEALYTAPR